MRLNSSQRGLTLIELLVGMAILVVALSIGMPSFESIGHASRLSSSASELGSALQLARSEAVRRNRNVVLCRSDDGATCASASSNPWAGWIVFADDNGDDQAGSGETVIRAGTFASSVQVRASAAISGRSNRVTYLSTGVARGSDQRALLTATIAVCAASNRIADNTREVNIAFGSRTSLQAKNTGGACDAPADS